MEGNFRMEIPPPSANIVCGTELNRSNSEASSLSVDKCEHSPRSANEKPDDSTITWTDEKHSIYLEHLEVSFVRQLHQSMNLLARCSEQSKRDKNISQIQPIYVNNTYEQYGCWQKINYKGNNLSRVSADSRYPSKSPPMNGSNSMGMQCPPASADMPEMLTRRGIENRGKGIISRGSQTCSQQFCASRRYRGDLHDLVREGTGQNFVDEDVQNKSYTGSRVKKLKTALEDSSKHDQIVPSKNFPTSDY